MPFPPPCTDSIDWDDIGFRAREVNGHVECHYSVHTGEWSEPQFIQDPYLRVHGLAPALNYGQQAFEGMKSFRDPAGQIRIFRPSRNAARMVNSARVVSIPPIPEAHFLKCVHQAVALNAEYVPPHHTGAAMYIRPLVFGSCAQLGLEPPEEYAFVVYVLPVGVYHGVRPVDALILEEFDRAAPQGTGSAKVGGNYAPVMRWSSRARSEGFGITLHLDSKTRTVIDEFSTSAFLGLKKDEQGHGYTMVVAESHSAIESVTSDSCQELAKSFGWKVDVRPVPYTELSSFTEVIAAGTAAALVPIKSITMRSRDQKFVYGGDEPGPGLVKLLATLKAIQQGKIEDSFHWCELVHQPPNWDALELERAKKEKGESAAAATNRVNPVVHKLP